MTRSTSAPSRSAALGGFDVMLSSDGRGVGEERR
jgi:hypothetical protein